MGFEAIERAIDLAERVIAVRRVFARASLIFVSSSLSYAVGVLILYLATALGLESVFEYVATAASFGILCGILATALAHRRVGRVIELPMELTSVSRYMVPFLIALGIYGATQLSYCYALKTLGLNPVSTIPLAPRALSTALPHYGFYLYAWTMATLAMMGSAYTYFTAVGWRTGRVAPLALSAVLGIATSAPSSMWTLPLLSLPTAMLTLAAVSLWGLLRWSETRS